MRPVASAGTRARTRAFSNSMSLGLIEAIGAGHSMPIANCPKILETSECSFHCNLPRFDRIEAGAGPQFVTPGLRGTGCRVCHQRQRLTEAGLF